MKKKKINFIAGLIIIFSIAGCIGAETDTQLARRVFNGLCNGRQGVQDLIDWETFKASGVDVGQAYSNIVAEKERADYRKVFFYNLSYTFKASGGKTSAFTNWRVKSREGNNTIVAADTAMGKVILLTLSVKKGKRKLTAIDFQQ